MLAGVIALAVAIGFGLAAGVWSFVASKRKWLAEFGGREPLVVDEVFARYYGNSGLERNVVVRLWNECAAKLRIPPEKLRPTDRFEHELAASDFWASLDDPREDLARHATAHARRFGVAIDLKGMKTLDELIRQLAEVEAPRSTAEGRAGDGTLSKLSTDAFSGTARLFARSVESAPAPRIVTFLPVPDRVRTARHLIATFGSLSAAASRPLVNDPGAPW